MVILRASRVDSSVPKAILFKVVNAFNTSSRIAVLFLRMLDLLTFVDIHSGNVTIGGSFGLIHNCKCLVYVIQGPFLSIARSPYHITNHKTGQRERWKMKIIRVMLFVL